LPAVPRETAVVVDTGAAAHIVGMTTIEGKTSAQHTADATNSARARSESIERSDTDGFLSQWASGLSAQESSAKAELAAAAGMVETQALFLLDGTVASTHETRGQYGYSWVLNDTAAEALGRRFLSTSGARKGQRRYDADRSKGVTLGTIRVPGYVTMSGADGARGLGGCLSVHVVTLPRVDSLMAGEFTVLATDSGPTSDR